MVLLSSEHCPLLKRLELTINRKTGGNPTKLFFFVNEEFFHFSQISLVILKLMRFFAYVTNTQAYQRKSEIWKNESLVRLTPDLIKENYFLRSLLSSVPTRRVWQSRDVWKP